jgi:hypothetical protein
VIESDFYVDKNGAVKIYRIIIQLCPLLFSLFPLFVS